jgi:hypothetical protein
MNDILLSEIWNNFKCKTQNVKVFPLQTNKRTNEQTNKRTNEQQKNYNSVATKSSQNALI